MALMVNRNAPMSGLANLMALKGRMGDTELVHMSKPEIRGLASLGKLTVNPSTGLPEAFSLGDILPVVAGIAASALLPGSGLAGGLFSGIGGTALAGGLGTFAGSLLGGKSLDQALTQGVLSGLTGYAMGNIFSAGADPTGGNGLSKGLEMTAAADLGDDILAPSQLQAMKEMGYYSQGFTPGEVGFSSGEGFTTKPSWFAKTFTGAEPVTVPANQVMSAADAYNITGGKVGYLPATEALQKPGTYASALGSLAATAMEPEPYQAPEKKKFEPKSYELVGGETIRVPTAEEATYESIYGGTQRQLNPYRYVKNGGLIGLAEGGVPKVMEGGEVKYVPTAQSALKDALLGPSQQMIEPYKMRDKSLEEMSEEERKKAILGNVQQGTMRNIMDFMLKKGMFKSGNVALTPEGKNFNPSGFNVGSNVGNTKGYSKGGDIEEQGEYFEGRVKGNGDGMSDEVEYEVEGEDPDMAMLSRDEYVLPADVVAIIGNGSSEAGADKLDMFVKQTRKKAFGTEKQQKEMPNDGGLAGLVA